LPSARAPPDWSVADLERAFGDRALVISWLNRGTLHLVRARTTRGCRR
jgi:hypothetical protein